MKKEEVFDEEGKEFPKGATKAPFCYPSLRFPSALRLRSFLHLAALPPSEDAHFICCVDKFC